MTEMRVNGATLVEEEKKEPEKKAIDKSEQLLDFTSVFKQNTKAGKSMQRRQKKLAS